MAAILVVDDEVDGTEAVAQALIAAGHQVRVARDGEEAMSAVSDAKPDLIVLDMMMPRMDGPAFLGVLRSYLGWQRVPVVLLTAYPENVHRVEAERLGVRDVLLKGKVPLAELRRRIEAALDMPPGGSTVQPHRHPVAGA